LSYGVEGDQLNIFITPKEGAVLPDDVATSSADFDFDLIITLDVQTFRNLGPLFETNAEFFYQTPVLNIDHHATNESFGQINLIDLVATSTAEIVLELLQQLKPDLVDDAVATNLLTGIITKTRCFRTSSVTPKSLAAASRLIEVGAKRDEIIRHLYQTHSLSTLKLWGRALARLKEDFRGQFVWTLIGQTDFEKSGTDEVALLGVIEELIANTPRARVVAILYEPEPGKTRALVSSHQPLRNNELFAGRSIDGTGEHATVDFLGTDINAVEAEIQERVSAYFKKQGLLG
jgi:phosphoesterase RecJ-like protein